MDNKNALAPSATTLGSVSTDYIKHILGELWEYDFDNTCYNYTDKLAVQKKIQEY